MRERPARVLLVAPSLRILGGQAVQASRLLSHLRRRSEVELAFQPINPPIGVLRQIRFVRTAAAFVVYVTCIFARAWRYDVLHVFSASHWSYALWTLPALAAAKLYRRKIILNYRDGRAEEHLRTWRLALPTMRMMDLIVAPSGFLVDVFRHFGLPARTIFNAIDASVFRFRPRRRLRPVFLHNRILEPLYNVECTLRAFGIIQDRYPDAELTVAHDGPLRVRLEDYARELGLRNVRFVGSIPYSQIPDLYDAADIYLTSPDVDCMPGSLLECFASGLPVVATAAGGIPYIATNERTALLVGLDDHEAMARAACRLLGNEALVERLTAAAREECRRYDPSEVATEWLRVYEELCPGCRTSLPACGTPQGARLSD